MIKKCLSCGKEWDTTIPYTDDHCHIAAGDTISASLIASDESLHLFSSSYNYLPPTKVVTCPKCQHSFEVQVR